MARATYLTQEFGAELRTFELPIAQLEELDEKCKAGPAAILGRLRDGTWRVADVRETIRLGLIGGGLDRNAALALVRRHVDGEPLAESVVLAALIVTAVLYGLVRDDVPGKPTAAQSGTDPTGSTSPPSGATPS